MLPASRPAMKVVVLLVCFEPCSQQILPDMFRMFLLHEVQPVNSKMISSDEMYIRSHIVVADLAEVAAATRQHEIAHMPFS